MNNSPLRQEYNNKATFSAIQNGAHHVFWLQYKHIPKVTSSQFESL